MPERIRENYIDCYVIIDGGVCNGDREYQYTGVFFCVEIAPLKSDVLLDRDESGTKVG